MNSLYSSTSDISVSIIFSRQLLAVHAGYLTYILVIDELDLWNMHVSSMKIVTII